MPARPSPGGYPPSPGSTSTRSKKNSWINPRPPPSAVPGWPMSPQRIFAGAWKRLVRRLRRAADHMASLLRSMLAGGRLRSLVIRRALGAGTPQVHHQSTPGTWRPRQVQSMAQAQETCRGMTVPWHMTSPACWWPDLGSRRTRRHLCRSQAGCRSSNQVTVRPPRCRHPHRAARPATRCSPRPPSASRPAQESSGTPGPLRSVTSTRTRPSPALTATVTVPPRSARPAVSDTIAEQLAHQQRGVVPARVPGTEHPGCERGGDTRPLLPPGHRHALPDRYPSHQRTRPSPPSTIPGESHRAAGRTHVDARSTQRLTSSRTPSRRGLSVAVRGKPTVHTDRPGARILSAMRPWTPRHRDLQRYKVTHGGTRRKRPG